MCGGGRGGVKNTPPFYFDPHIAYITEISLEFRETRARGLHSEAEMKPPGRKSWGK